MFARNLKGESKLLFPQCKMAFGFPINSQQFSQIFFQYHLPAIFLQAFFCIICRLLGTESDLIPPKRIELLLLAPRLGRPEVSQSSSFSQLGSIEGIVLQFFCGGLCSKNHGPLLLTRYFVCGSLAQFS